MEEAIFDFQGFVTKLTAGRKKLKSYNAEGETVIEEKPIQTINVRVSGNAASSMDFLKPLQTKCGVPNVTNLFAWPFSWKALNLVPSNKVEFDVNIGDSAAFNADLISVKVKWSTKKDVDVLTFDFVLEKEQDSIDATIGYYVNKKEENEEGKLVATPIECRFFAAN